LADGKFVTCLSRAAPWRRKSASDAQKKLIRGKLEYAKGRPGGEERLEKLIYTSLERRSGQISPVKLPIGEVVETLTKGEASNILSKLMHGSLVSLMRAFWMAFGWPLFQLLQAAIKSAEKARVEEQKLLAAAVHKKNSEASARALFLQAESHRHNLRAGTGSIN
jgi:hypothetical protein